MSSIEKLNIIGVRSFSHRDSGQSIKFKAPLTLIVGDNGSGKTTIIESLKYASTGDLPPGAKNNSAFIHDPKLTRDAEVMAQVKMKFQNAQGVSYVTTRRITSTVLPSGAYKQKSLESSLVVETKDERSSHSLKAKQIEQAVPRFMGVSPAIINNVIFCHQDESLWPMSEPKTLKEKFDQIFEAEQYTKAITNVNKLKTEYGVKCKLLAVEEKNSKDLLNKSKRASKRIEAVADAIEEKRAQIGVLNKDIAAAEEIFQEKERLMREAQGVVNEIENKHQKVANIQYILDKIRVTLKERPESLEWLKSTLAQFEDQIKDHERQAASLEQKYKTIIDSLSTTRQDLSTQQRDQGKQTARKQQHEANLQERINLVKEAALSHSLRDYDGDLDEEAIQKFLSRIQSMNQAKDRELNRVKEDTADKVREHQDAMTSIQQQVASRKSERHTAKAQIVTNDTIIRKKQLEMNSILMNEGRKNELDISLREAEEKLEKARSAFASAGWDRKLASEKKHLAELEGEYTRLGQEVMQRTKTMKDTAALDLARKEAQQAQVSLDTMTSAHGEQITKFLGHAWTPKTLKRDYSTVLTGLDGRISDARKSKASADKVYHEHTFKLQAAKSDLEKKNGEVERCNTVLLESILTPEGNPITSVEEYLQELEATEKEYQERQKELEGVSFSSDYYKKALGFIRDRNCCRLCERGFVSPSEKQSATTKVERLLQKYVQEDLEKDLKELEKDLNKAQKARPQYEIWKRLRESEIPALKRDIKAMEDKNQSLRTSCEKADEKLEAVEAEKRDAQGFENTVADITKHNMEIAKQEERVTRLSSQQKLSGSSLTLEEIEKQQESCNEKIKSTKAKIDKLSANREAANTEIGDCERIIGSLSNDVNSAQHLLEKKEGLSDSIKNDRENTDRQHAIIAKANEDFAKLEPELAKLKEQRDDAQRRGNEKTEKLQEDKNKLSETVRILNTIEKSVSDYLDSGGPGKLAACEREIASLEEKVNRLDDERVSVTNKANEITKFKDKIEETKQSLAENIQHRELSEDKKRLDAEIEALEARNTRREFEQYLREAKIADKNKTELNAERTRLQTQMTSEDEQLAALNAHWVQDYEGIDKKWQKDNIQIQTHTAVAQDLQKCVTALDKAIIAFHTKKMEDVNSIAGDLWRSTYQGTDVDTIMIKSEDGNSTSTSMRKFNYRLVMVKQDAELDMRSRCSAGQRVLACIIIRLALAESFGSSCGVIALDEPTTNLDMDNTKALARSLHMIIQTRKHQKNFQLLVITHDEAFIREMKCRDFTDEYYRVSRDADQNSRIKKQDLSAIDED